MGFWRIYYRVGSFVGACTVTSNLSSPWWVPKKHQVLDRKKIIESPLLFTSICLTKGLFFGALWPAVVVKLAVDPWSVVAPGSGLKKLAEEIDKKGNDY
uniref:Uncharacterized protein n=1 Tax=Clandestinovirus TaxID=2831644 RepID=A0A8F8KP95_9VIRU|nr:hypothetical protein KOM_12_287 [Clandestinovirus]